MQPVGPQVPDEQHVQQVLDLCMRMGEVLLASGEGSGETTDTMLRVANAFGVATVDVDIAFTAGTICCHRGMAATPIISLRVVTYRALDLTLLATVYRLVEDVERGRLDLLAAASTLDRAVKAVHPYPRWVATAGLAGLAGAVALLLGAPWVAVPVAGGDHRSHRRHQPSARPPAAPRVLPTGARRLHRDRGDDGVHRDRCAACGHRGGAGGRGRHHRAAVRVRGRQHGAGRDRWLRRDGGGPGRGDRGRIGRLAQRCRARVEARAARRSAAGRCSRAAR